MTTDALTPKQARFCEEYLVDLNATQAAIRAGYSAKTARVQGGRLLLNVAIAARVAAMRSEQAERVEVTADYVLSSLTEVVERCMQRSPVMVKRGKELVQLIDDEGRHVWRFDATGAIGGLGLLGKHLKLFTEKHEHSGPDGGPMEVDVSDLRARLAARLAARTGGA